MILFLSQAPAICTLFPVMIGIAVLEAAGLKVRRNILILSVVALALLCTNFVLRPWLPGLGALLPSLGITLALVLFLYTTATAWRGKQWPWFVALLVAAAATLGAIIGSRTMIPATQAVLLAAVDVALAFVLPVSTLAYGLFAPDIARVGGRMLYGRDVRRSGGRMWPPRRG